MKCNECSTPSIQTPDEVSASNALSISRMVNGESFLKNGDVNDALTGDRMVTNTRTEIELGTKIRELMEFVNLRHNVYGVIKEKLRTMMATYIKAREQLEAGKHQRDTVESATQTPVSLSLNNIKGVAKDPQNAKFRSKHREFHREVTEEASKRERKGKRLKKSQGRHLTVVAAITEMKIEELTQKRIENRKKHEKMARLDSIHYY
ncbi:unnamed protein product [Hermetia illucens]|uniref:Uncharacterized protein n=1 Tax=Hermetia illucens TaxID=343691 RepID=A0A7R8YWL3_HERIL|nr:unnamed protein product [Hermetia illucens]